MFRKDDNPTVYSTETGRMCTRCGRPVDACVCKTSRARPKGDGVVRLMFQSKGRKGKPVTLVTGLPLEDDALAELASELKRKCGAGGAVKDGVIEIQGDQRHTLLPILKKLGYVVKKAGG